MVIRDLSTYEARPKEHHEEIRIAFVFDRFLAAVFDFLIFSPVISLAVAGVVKQIKTALIVDSRSIEANIMWVFFLVLSFTLAVFLQSVFIYLWQATPGQKFFQLKVISYPKRFEALSYSQCLLRSILWFCSLLFLGIPFLEVIGHPLRRSFHERASDTLVITLKEEYDSGPVYIERRFIGSWLRVFFLSVFALATVYGLKTYRLAQEGYFDKAFDNTNKMYCEKIPVNKYQGIKRQDLAISLFLLEQIDEACLNKEADVFLWNSHTLDKSWAYLMKGLASSDKTSKDKYMTKVCEGSKKSESCIIATYIADEENADIHMLKQNKLNSDTAQILLLTHLVDESQYVRAIEMIKNLQADASVLEAPLEKIYVKTIWQMTELSKNNSRRPASVQTDQYIHEFKEKYGVE